MRTVVLVDGEHHPDAVRAAIAELTSGGFEIVGAVFCGGTEKVDTSKIDEEYGVPVVHHQDGVVVAVNGAMTRFAPERVVDMTDEPVLLPPERFRVASAILASGATYSGGDFELRPPSFEHVLHKPSIRVFATGKRTGKTAVASSLARFAIGRGLRPAIIAVGRGGPPDPRVIEAGTPFDAQALIELADSGFHAASDYIEDAMTSGATTIGCRRVGGGLAGGTVTSNVVAAAHLADQRDENLVILEGSGASIPGVAADAGVICVPASEDTNVVCGYLNPYRLLLADLAVITMAEQGSAAADLEAAIRSIDPQIDVLPVVFRPRPLEPVEGKRAFFCFTALKKAGSGLVRHLEREHGCKVVGTTHRLGDRRALTADLDAAPDYEVLLTEIKGPAVDVAARRAVGEGREVVFIDNEVVGDGVDEAFARIVQRAGA